MWYYYYICIQPNGERIPIERWLYQAWLHGAYYDPEVTKYIRNAVRVVAPVF